ncbi:outer membrane beta-barrel family protein [Flavobacterium frigoris]|uniref:Outer membrane receptor proteins, mostly Fe transport n=3 Tax=Flavobacterium frigoris TaxID=229204 RepID=A0A1H9HRW9_FLAFI|nr:outer membrane beta-barrel family protein [Flavobacterium frigoris]SEQ65073.1 Outer membrane receptor proteins, mostly Fe transport [Flavobacterium frigoris]
MFKKIFSSALFFFCLIGFSQDNLTLKIELTNSKYEIIKEGNAYLFNSETNQLIKIESIVDSHFLFTSLNKGNYNIQIQCKDFEDIDQKVTLNQNLNLKLVLSKISITELNEIVLKSEKKIFTNTNGNIKVDIASSLFEAVPNPMDLLSKLPGIQISGDKESISIVGKGNALIYIDNQKVGINDLNALSVEDIKTIEIIKNPSSKYEAEGKAVILITIKLSKKDGFETTISEVASFKKRFNNYLSINSSFKKNKTEIKTNFGYNLLNPWESIGNNFEIPNKNIDSDFIAESFTRRRQFILGGGIYHQINEDDYLSFNMSGKIQKDNDKNTTNSFISQINVQNNIETLNNNDENRNFLNSFINYNKKIKSLDAKLFTGFQYSNFYQKSNSVIQNNYNNTQFDLIQNRNQKFNVNVFSGRTDLEKSFKNEIKWEIGALYLSAEANTNFEVIDFISNNNEFTNYNFKEKNIAGYTQLSGKIKKLNYLIGIRTENTNIKGKYKIDDNLLINKNYTNFFPKFQIDIPIDSTKTISLNYAKSISRPNYSSTSQVSIYTNPFLVFSRNINLNPTISDEISGTFQFKNKSVKLNFFQSKDTVYFAFSFDSSINLISFNSINYAKESGFNLEFTLPFKQKFWTSTNNFNFILNKIEDKSAVFNESKPYLYYYSNHIFELPKEFDFSITGWGFTERKEGVFKRNSLFIMDLALSKTLLKNFDCTLSFNDVFRNMNFNENFTINDIASKGIYYTDTREISFSLRYKFGRIKDSNYQERNIDENSNRIR